MVTMKRICRTVVGVVCAVGLTAGAGSLVAHAEAAEQNAESTAELRALQLELDGVRSEVEGLSETGLSPRRSGRLADLQSEVNELEDELAYLRVTLRREGAIPQRELDAYRVRLNAVSRQLEDDAKSTESGEVVVPVGTEMDVRLQSSLHSDTAEVEDRFYATVATDLLVGDRVAIPAGADVRGVVSAVDRSSRSDRSASLTLTFDQVTAAGRTYPARMTLTDAQESGIKDEAARIGIGAGVGGVIGGLLGGTKGALAGILIGGGGTVAATEGEDVDLPAGTTLRVRFDSTLAVETQTR